jgi:hypothetical protein
MMLLARVILTIFASLPQASAQSSSAFKLKLQHTGFMLPASVKLQLQQASNSAVHTASAGFKLKLQLCRLQPLASFNFNK